MSLSYYVPSEEKLQTLKDLSDLCIQEFTVGVVPYIENNELVLRVDKVVLINVIQVLRDKIKLGFKQLTDITAVDYPEKEHRFEVVYQLLNIASNIRVRIKVNITENEMLDSVEYLYDNANWLEREVYDMFGIYFKGHSDLRRLLTDFGFEGNPLRKDFPLTGFVEVTYSEELHRVIYKPVELMQAYRDFDYKSPWMEGIHKDTFGYLNNNKDTTGKE